MEQALVLLIVEPSAEGDVLRKIRGFPEVIEAHFIYGPYDIYVKIQAETMDELRRLVLDEIRNVSGIRSTMTCFVAD